MVVRRRRQRKAKRQRIEVQIGVCPIRLTYDTNVRREGVSGRREKALWLVGVSLPGTDQAPWLLMTDWPVTEAESAVRIFQMYRQRWAVEDSFRFVKDTLGWEEVQLLSLEGIRTMLALGWVAAGFLYELGVTLEWEEVQLLARLGGWVEKKGNKPGKTIMTRGLGRILDMLVTQSQLERYRAEHGALPPRIAAIIRSFPSGEL
jgi:transposase